MTTTYRVVLLVRAESVAEVKDDLGTTLGYSQLDLSLSSVAEVAETMSLPVIPATCNDCEAFDRWNDGTCMLDEHGVNAERAEAPPPNCPKRKACPTCGSVPQQLTP